MIKNINISCSCSFKDLNKVENWLIPSLINQNKLKHINLFLINYAENKKLFTKKINSNKINVIELYFKKVGFGEAHNLVFKYVKPKEKFFMIVNPDVYMHNDCIFNLIKTFNSNKKVGIVEARQLPFEHPKEYSISNQETPWASGFCSLINTKLFEINNGFDEKFWMYCEDVDFSWRTWLNNYKVLYEPRAVAYHYTGSYFNYNNYQYYLEQFWSAQNFIYLMYKFWGTVGEHVAIKLLNKTSYSNDFKQKILQSYKSRNLRRNFFRFPNIKILKYKNKIKVLGFNQYHEFNEN